MTATCSCGQCGSPDCEELRLGGGTRVSKARGVDCHSGRAPEPPLPPDDLRVTFVLAEETIADMMFGGAIDAAISRDEYTVEPVPRQGAEKRSKDRGRSV